MKRTTFKLTLAFTLAVCSLAGCEKTDSDFKNDEKKNTTTSALTTALVTSESSSTTVTNLADITDAIQQTQTETALTDQTEPSQTDKTDDTTVEQNGSKSDTITEKQAFDAIQNYCFIRNPNLKNMVDSGEYNIYWEVHTNDANEIVVLYRSYTAAQTRYYIDPVSGETYVTELVPGIIDEEQRTEESFNIRDYLA
ncbi:hypothetical protein SAMN02910265_02935 [Ruminococcus flavefaciens]|uniref:Lipoprotein n=1 Tax=Ruminococcus flavefaciens TaxID=1265 RepID=A0A1H6L403_RUMFL|nr:hypothetical protein [Ruminococcus flavefaciens]SEH83077.1 hypothetical protein SAMN02910265_02935 [Ruminococcus flavefaciens]